MNMTSQKNSELSLMERLARAAKGKRDRFINSLPPEKLLALKYNWKCWARPKQLPPSGDWFGWLILSGRGFGKTRTGAEWILDRVRHGYKKIALVGETSADVRDTMVELGESSIMQIAAPWERPTYQPSKRRLTFPNGATATTFSGDEPDQLRGPAHDTAWVDELAKFRYAQETWDNLELGLREGPHPQVFISTTPRPIKIIKEMVADSSIVVTCGSSYENSTNLAPKFFERIRSKYEGTRLGKQELYGEILDDFPGALWTQNMIDAYRVKQAPSLVRVVVGVDPAVTAKKDSDETGIVVAGKDAIGHCYVLADNSLRGSPLEWGTAAIAGYMNHSADRVIGEVNNGGDLIEMNLRNIDPSVSYTSVHASRGKYIRAEPIAALYEQGIVHHVGQFPEMEDQMCSFCPETAGDAHDDRMDALVYAITELGITLTPHVSAGEPQYDTYAAKKIDEEIAAVLDSMTPEERIEANRLLREDSP